jgi:epoxyqueuosine reductase
MSPSQKIKTFAKSIGIDLIGFAPALPDEEGQTRLRDFLKEQRHGNMLYLEDSFKRTHPQELLPGAKSVIVIAVNYYREAEPVPAGNGRFARYAYGRDYHKVIKKLLKQIEAFIIQNAPNALCKPCVDSAPLLEKSYAVRAGLGFLGKNTTLITPEFGSFVLLGELLTTLELDYDKPKTGTCGTCARCLAACPTKALIGPGQMAATRCISYLTIENARTGCIGAAGQSCSASPDSERDEEVIMQKGKPGIGLSETPQKSSGDGDTRPGARIKQIPKEFQAPMGDRIFGCDVCQEVCPYNKAFAKPLQLPALRDVKIAGFSIPLAEILSIKTDADFTRRFAGSPVMRAKRAGLQRNARVAMKNRQAGRENG